MPLIQIAERRGGPVTILTLAGHLVLIAAPPVVAGALFLDDARARSTRRA